MNNHKPLHLTYKPLLIGIAGYAQAGKDTSAELLRKNHGFVRFAFADHLKDIVCNIEPDVVEAVDELGWDEAKRKHPFVRQELQHVGVYFRETHGSYFWVNFVAEQINHQQPEAIAIPDVRFPNEAAWIRENGGIVVRVERAGIEPANGHISETPLISERPVQNTTMAELASQLDDAVKMAERARNLEPLFFGVEMAKWEAR